MNNTTCRRALMEAGMAYGGFSLAEPWHGLTLTGLLSSAAHAHPRRLFLADCPRRTEWAGSPPRMMTYSQAWHDAQFFAGQLRALGIREDETVLILLPNVVEFPITVFGTLLAGAIPAIAPVDESIDRLRAMAERSNAVAIITLSHIEDLALAEKARHVAAKVMAIRCIAGYGHNLPEGVTALDGWNEDDVSPLEDTSSTGQDRLSLITFARRKGSICAFLRAEGQIIADTLAIASVLKPATGITFLTALQPGAASCFVTSLSLPLFLGARIQYSGPFDGESLALLAGANAGAYLIAPSHLHDAIEHARINDHLPLAFDSLAGTIAHARAGDGGLIVSPQGMKGALLLADFDEAAMISCAKWPEAGTFTIPHRLTHPMQNILPAGQFQLVRLPDEDGIVRFDGFSAAVILKREDGGKTEPVRAEKAA